MILLPALLLTVTAALAPVPQKPDPLKTPGAVFPEATRETVCVSGYSASVRSVPGSLKKKIFALYGIDPKSGRFEVDHLIPLELGGSNSVKNLWPQSFTSHPYNARAKNRLENRLRKMVCSGAITLKKAQEAIAKDWTKAYKKYMK